MAETFYSNFEAGTWAGWTLSSDSESLLSIHPDAALGGSSYGVRIKVSAGSSASASYYRSSTGAITRFGFQIDATNLTLDDGDNILLFGQRNVVGGIVPDGNSGLRGSFAIRRSGSNYQCRGFSFNKTTSWVTFNKNAKHWVEFIRQNSGTEKIALFMDGLLLTENVVTLTGADPDSCQLGIAPGNGSGSSQALGAGAGGYVYIDNVVVRNDAIEIGEERVVEPQVFNIGHEFGDGSEYTATSGAVTYITDAAAVATSYGLRIAHTTTAAWAARDTGTLNSGIIRARFYFNKSTAAATGEGFFFTFDGASDLWLGYNGSGMAWRLAIAGSSTQRSTGSAIGSGWQRVEIEFDFSTKTASLYLNGSGTPEISVTGNAASYSFTRIQVGTTIPGSGASGEMFFDEVILQNIAGDIGAHSTNQITHEIGNAAEYRVAAVTSGAATIDVVPEAALIGTGYGLKSTLGNASPHHAYYDRKATIPATTSWRTRFYFDPNTVTLGDGNAIAICLARRPGPFNTFRVQTRQDAGYHLDLDAGNTALDTVSITDAPHIVELWIKGDGNIQWWVDGEDQGTVAGFSTDAIDVLRFGFTQGTTLQSGSVYTDEIAWHLGDVEIGGTVPGQQAGGDAGSAVFSGMKRAAGSSMLIVMRRRRRD